jgi:Flp pilus assembly protein TadD
MRAPLLLCVIVATGWLTACVNAPEGGGAASSDDPGDGLLRLAADVEAHGQDAVALSLYRRAVTVSGQSPRAYVQLGDANLRAGKIGPAVGAYRAALAKAPADADALLGLGSALLRQGKPEEALDDLAQAAPVVKSAAAYDRLGVAQTLVGQLPEAQASFESAIALAPDDLDLRTNWALAAALDGKDDAAVEMMRQVVQSPGAEPRHQRDFVVLLGMIGRADEARAATSTGLPPAELRHLLERAASIRSMATIKARAKALGTVTGS